MHGRVVTPDMLEFAVSFPSVVQELLKKATTLLFHYFTSQDSHYEQAAGFIPFNELPQIPKIPTVEITENDRQLLSQYRKTYLIGVKQLSIRQQNTKSKAGNLPLYACVSVPVESNPLQLKEKLAGEIVLSVDDQRRVCITAGTVILLRNDVKNIAGSVGLNNPDIYIYWYSKS